MSKRSIGAAVVVVVLTAGFLVVTQPMNAQRGDQAPDTAGRGGRGGQGGRGGGGAGRGAAAEAPAIRKQPEAAGCPGDPAEFFPCATEKAKTFKPARMPGGKPDFRGFWATGRQAFVIEEHAAEQGLQGETSLIVDPADGKVPYKPEAAARRAQIVAQHGSLKTSTEFMDPSARCFSKGIPRQHTNNPFPIEFYQTSKTFFILHEQNHVYEVIPLDGSPHPSKNIKLWMGDERGHWEGDTLVVETTNHNGKSWLDERGTFFSDNAKVTEKYTLIDPDVIFYRATIEDPTVFTKPWTIGFPLRRNKDQGLERMEFACHEGNKSNELQLAGAKK